MKNVKYLVRKTSEQKEDFREALLAFRNTARKDGSSPAQLMLGRRLHGRLPVLPLHLRLDGAQQAAGAVAKQDLRAEQRAQHDAAAARPEPLKVGDSVIVQHPATKRWTIQATISDTLKRVNTFVLTDNEGKKFVRNSQFIRKTPLLTKEKDSSAGSGKVNSSIPTQSVRRSERLKDKKQ